MPPPENTAAPLAASAANRLSQWGEDGVIARIFELVTPTTRWCVEFGAWDGVRNSNTRALMEQGWSGVHIEAAAQRFTELQRLYAGDDRAVLLNALVGWDGDSTLDNLLAATPVPEEFDLLSIDIDGNDYHVWRALQRFRPRVVVIEFNSTIPDDVHFVQPPDPGVNQGTSLLAMTRLAEEKGYGLAAVTSFNAFFVRSELLERLGIADSSPAAIRTDHSNELRVFQLFDGTLVWEGRTQLLWANLPLRPEQLQAIPAWARFQPGPQHSFGRRALRRLYLEVKRRRTRCATS